MQCGRCKRELAKTIDEPKGNGCDEGDQIFKGLMVMKRDGRQLLKCPDCGAMNRVRLVIPRIGEGDAQQPGCDTP